MVKALLNLEKEWNGLGLLVGLICGVEWGMVVIFSFAAMVRERKDIARDNLEEGISMLNT